MNLVLVFTILIDALIVLLVINLYLIVKRAPSGSRWPLVVLQIGLVTAGLAAALLLPFRSLVQYYWQLWSLVATVGLSFALAVGLLFRLVWTRASVLRTAILRLSLACLGVLLVFLTLELCFKLFWVQSDGFLVTLGARNWVRQYWQPVNSLGYRDVEHSLPPAPGREQIVVLGDSYVAGLGIKKVDQRFADRLGAMLGPLAEVHVVADAGWSTSDAIDALASHPVRPDRVIYSYYVNDIESAAERVGQLRPDVLGRPSGAVALTIEHSFLLNFAYWRIYRMRSGMLGLSYFDYLDQCHRDQAVWSEQVEDFDRLLAAAPESSEWLVVVFPHLRSVEKYRPMTDRVVDHFRDRGVPVVDLAAELGSRPWRQLVVNSQDSHASVALNQEVAELIYRRLVSAPGE